MDTTALNVELPPKYRARWLAPRVMLTRGDTSTWEHEFYGYALELFSDGGVNVHWDDGVTNVVPSSDLTFIQPRLTIPED